MTQLASVFSPLSLPLVLGLTSSLVACGGPGGRVDGATDGDPTGTAGIDPDDDDDDDDDDDTGDHSGTTGEPGTGEPETDDVRILRDAHGVPHIVAPTDAGALYGLGWASAEDRLLQMTISALSAQGRLAEHFGPEYLEADVRMRTMGMWRHAERMALALDAEHLALLEAYAQGVNDAVAANPGVGGSLFEDLGVERPSWTPAHSLAVWYRTSDLFTNDPLGKAAAHEEFMELVALVGIDAAIDQTVGTPAPGQSEAAVVQAADVPLEVQDAVHSYAATMGYGAPALGAAPLGFAGTQPKSYGHQTPKFSHAWVVSGERTATGQAALVSDPQVAVFSPNFLYEFAVVGETIHARGVSPAGVPGLLIGFTPEVAWGMTAAGIDQRDLFRLQTPDRYHYIVDGEEHEMIVETQTVLVAGGNARELEYRESEWGPVITTLLPGGVQGEYALKGLPFAVTERDPFVAMVGMMRASTLDQLRAALEHWTTPSANLVAAGPGGDIFYTLVGDIPLRSPQSPLGGMIAQDGSSAQYDWVDLIPADIKPWVLNPGDGFLLSANHRPVADWYPLPLGVGQGGRGDTLRSRRLRELLQALPDTVEPHAVVDDVQWDCVNAARRDLVALGAHVRSLQPGRLSASTHALLDALAPWLAAGGTMDTQQAGVFLADHIGVKFRVQQTGPVLNAQFGGGATGLDLFLDTMMAAIAGDPTFIPSDDAVAYLDLTLGSAWDSSLAQAPDQAQWDQIYADTVASPVFPYLVGPDLASTSLGVSVQSPTLRCADGNTIWSQRGETYTQYVDLGAVDQSLTVMPPGNSGDPEAEAFSSQLDAWAEGTLKPTALSVAAIEALAVEEQPLPFPG